MTVRRDFMLERPRVRDVRGCLGHTVQMDATDAFDVTLQETLNGIAMVPGTASPNTIRWAVGNNGTIRKTINSGSNWTNACCKSSKSR